MEPSVSDHVSRYVSVPVPYPFGLPYHVMRSRLVEVLGNSKDPDCLVLLIPDDLRLFHPLSLLTDFHRRRKTSLHISQESLGCSSLGSLIYRSEVRERRETRGWPRRMTGSGCPLVTRSPRTTTLGTSSNRTPCLRPPLVPFYTSSSVYYRSCVEFDKICLSLKRPSV